MHAKSTFTLCVTLPNIAYSWWDLAWGSKTPDTPTNEAAPTEEQ